MEIRFNFLDKSFQIKSLLIAKDLPSYVSDGDSIKQFIILPELNPITGFLRIN
ncbi:hypothetical protein V6Z11_D02G126300 [Gossypium hirsutum]